MKTKQTLQKLQAANKVKAKQREVAAKQEQSRKKMEELERQNRLPEHGKGPTGAEARMKKLLKQKKKGA